MNITSVDMYDSKGILIAALSFRDPAARNPYLARAIIGLDADEIVSRFYAVSSQSKQKYYNLTLEQRDIVIRIQLNPQFSTQSYSELRDNLYKMIASSRTGLIELRFNNKTGSVAHVYGYIKKFEAGHFNEQPEVQITMECDDPILRGVDRVEPITVPTRLSSATITDDLSTAPHGFIFDVTFDQPSPSFIIEESATPEWAFTVTPGVIGSGTGFLAFDHLFYSSESGNKYLYMVRGGNTIQLVDKILHGSVWPILFPGDNFFDSADEEFTWNHVSYFPAYWGI